MRSKFHEQLTLLNNTLIEMGEIVEQTIGEAITALETQDIELAQKIIASDDIIDDKEEEIESLCLKIILQQQPVASDLRLVSAAMKIITDLERIGDHATDISEMTILLTGKQFITKLVHIMEMATATRRMLTESIAAFVNKDLDLARSVIAFDDTVDNLFLRVRNDLIELINDNAANGDQALDLVMIAKYFERIGDHATNIAEWVVFSITGAYKDAHII